MDKIPTDVLERPTSQSSPSTSLSKSTTTLRQVLADRLTHVEALEAVGKMLSSRGSGQPHDPKGYLGALAAVLMEYPKTVALKCADPIKGVCRETRFLPEIADIVKWCERETDALRKPVDQDDRDQHFARERKRMAEEDAYW